MAMKYTGRITLISISLSFTLISIFIFKESLMEEIPTAIITVMLGWLFGKQYDKAKFLSEKDFLTGAYNRRFVYESFPKLNKKSSYISILLIDINNFKQLNDKYGHESGDKALKVLGSLLLKNTRKTDIVSRWGGDEFLLLLSNVDQKDIEKIKVRIENEVSKEIGAYCKELNIGVSIGEATYPYEGKTLDDVIKVADQNMYNIKFENKEAVK
jgi:diguanylate cyclase (GGDEF)-like protein